MGAYRTYRTYRIGWGSQWGHRRPLEAEIHLAFLGPRRGRLGEPTWFLAPLPPLPPAGEIHLVFFGVPLPFVGQENLSFGLSTHLKCCQPNVASQILPARCQPYCLWLLFVATVCGYCLWLLFVATVCGYCLWLLFVATVCGYCLSRSATATRIGIPASILTTIHTHYPHRPAHTTSAGRCLVVARRRSSSSPPRALYPHPYSHPYPHPRSSRGPQPRSAHPRRWSAGRRRAPASILTTILTPVLTRGPPTPGPHHPRFGPPALVVASSSSPLRLYPHPPSSPEVLSHPLGSGLKRSSEALEAAATVRAWGAQRLDCEGLEAAATVRALEAAGLRGAEGIWGGLQPL